jgi:hypothetical protein
LTQGFSSLVEVLEPPIASATSAAVGASRTGAMAWAKSAAMGSPRAKKTLAPNQSPSGARSK